MIVDYFAYFYRGDAFISRTQRTAHTPTGRVGVRYIFYAGSFIGVNVHKKRRQEPDGTAPAFLLLRNFNAEGISVGSVPAAENKADDR